MQPCYCVFGHASTRVIPPTDDHEQEVRGTFLNSSRHLSLPKSHHIRGRAAQATGTRFSIKK